jgi:hypothetical protein
MDPTVFYYTYSTIAQTLAGAFGFLVAVVLYLIQSITNSLPHKAKNLGHHFHQGGQIDEPIRQGRWLKVLAVCQECGFAPQAPTVVRKDGESLLAEFRSDIETLEEVSKGLKKSLYPTGGTIIACLTIMPLTPLLAVAGSWVAVPPLVATVAVAVYTVTTYVGLVLKVTRYGGIRPEEAADARTVR